MLLLQSAGGVRYLRGRLSRSCAPNEADIGAVITSMAIRGDISRFVIILLCVQIFPR